MSQDQQPLLNTNLPLASNTSLKTGELKTITPFTAAISNIRLRITKNGSPTGNIICTIRNATYDLLATSSVVIDVTTIPLFPTYGTYDFPFSLNISFPIWFGIEYANGSYPTDVIRIGAYSPPVKSGEYVTYYDGTWKSLTDHNLYYIITYTESPPNVIADTTDDLLELIHESWQVQIFGNRAWSNNNKVFK